VTADHQAAERLRVNPVACDAHAACAELLPEMITLDEWGYPIVDPRPVPPALEKHARAAVSACPTLALRLTRELPVPAGSSGHPGLTRHFPISSQLTLHTEEPVKTSHIAQSLVPQYAEFRLVRFWAGRRMARLVAVPIHG
jgi:ferredoxin